MSDPSASPTPFRFPHPCRQMEFSSRARQRHLKLAGDRREPYPHSLQFYQEPPTESISLAEFESFAVDRLRRE